MNEEKTDSIDLDEDLQRCLKTLVDFCENEDSWVRKQQIKLWKKNEEFWHGIQFIFWSESRQDWMSPLETKWFQTEEGRESAEGPFYDFVVNIYKAHGEAVIASLGSMVPTVRFPPDDADNDDDIETSRTYAKISDLIDRHNQVKVLQLMSLFILWNQGIICWYHASKADKAFGMANIENYKKELYCPNCQQEKPVEDEENLIEGLHPCPTCGQPMTVREVLESFQQSPKSRVIVDVFGGLHVKVPYWARKQEEFSYLLKSLDQPSALLKHVYPDIADKIDADLTDSQQYEKVARSPSSYSSFSRVDENRDLKTHRQCWLRPWVLNNLPKEKEKEKKKLQKLFPNGIYVAFVGSIFADARDENLDKHWTVDKAGLSTYIHADPLGQPLISVQELRNVLVNLSIETIEQGMSSVFADPSVINFDEYSKHEARPGMMYEAKPRAGSTVASAFYESGRATLSKEVPAFGQQLDKDGQFVVGSFPSLYGGPGEGKSRTLGEYTQSRTQALQRLSIAWSLFCVAWARLKEKCVHLYVENLIDDEKYAVPDQSNKDNYVNVWIRKAQLTGKVGEVEAEGADSFPISTPQKQALFFKLLEMNNEMINAALFSPENRRYISDLTGFTELTIPDEDQRMKQMYEICQILQGAQVQVDPLVDSHGTHVETLRHYMVSTIGLDLQRTQPKIYAALAQHLQMHIQAMAPPPGPPQQQGQPPQGGPPQQGSGGPQ